MRDYASAKEWYEKALPTITLHYQIDEPARVAEAQQHLAVTLEKLGNYTEAKVLHEKALATKIAHYKTETHIDVAMTQYNFAELLFRLGDFTQAYLLVQMCETTCQTQSGGCQYLPSCQQLKQHLERKMQNQQVPSHLFFTRVKLGCEPPPGSYVDASGRTIIGVNQR